MQIDIRAMANAKKHPGKAQAAAFARFEGVRDVVDRVSSSLTELDNAHCDGDPRKGRVALEGDLSFPGAELLDSRAGYTYRGTSLHSVDAQMHFRTRPSDSALGWLGPLTHSVKSLHLSTDGGSDGAKVAGEYTFEREKGLQTWTFQPADGPGQTYTLRGGLLTVT